MNTQTEVSPRPEFRIVLRPFDGDRPYKTGEVVDVASWRNHGALITGRFLARMEYGDPEPVTCDCGSRWRDEVVMESQCCGGATGPLDTLATTNAVASPSGGSVPATHPAFRTEEEEDIKLADPSPPIVETGTDHEVPSETLAASTNSDAEPYKAPDS